MGTSRSRGVSPMGALAIALGFGLGWYAAECLAMAVSDPDFERVELARRALRFLPWHLAAFAALGVGVALVSRLWPLSGGAACWLVLAGAAALFLGARVAEGALHSATPGTALAHLAAATLAAGLAVAALAGLGALLPRRLRGSWPAAACASVSLLLIALLRRAGPGIGLGELGIAEAAGQLGITDAAWALSVGGLLLAAGGLRGRRAAIVAAAFLGAVAGAGPARAADAAPRPDVYVFLLDTLRADHLGGAETPALGALAPEFFRFRAAWSPSTRTSRSLPGIMTSLSVRTVGAALPPEAVTLAERLKDGGWSTFGVSANPQVATQFGYGQGFDSLTGLAEAPDFLIVPVLKLASSALPGLAYETGVSSAELFYPPIGELRRRALRFLDRSRGPSFVYAQTMDVHGPYLPPRRFLPPSYRRGDFTSYYEFLDLSSTPELRSAAMAPRLENLRQRYAGGVRYTDEELAGWIADLRARGRWDEALVWILSDHGEAFGEHGFAGHGFSYVGSAVTRIPLWLKPPRSAGLEPREIAETVSGYDLLPTTLALLGLPPVSPAFGSDLSPLLRGDPAAVERTVIVETDDGPGAALYAAVRGPLKLDVHFAADGTREVRALFDLERDPGETEDVRARHPEAAAALERAILERRGAEQALSLRRRDTPIDPQTRERLEALGYLDDE
jgi:arylsulfatase A-like enzyme